MAIALLIAVGALLIGLSQGHRWCWWTIVLLALGIASLTAASVAVFSAPIANLWTPNDTYPCRFWAALDMLCANNWGSAASVKKRELKAGLAGRLPVEDEQWTREYIQKLKSYVEVVDSDETHLWNEWKLDDNDPRRRDPKRPVSNKPRAAVNDILVTTLEAKTQDLEAICREIEKLLLEFFVADMVDAPSDFVADVMSGHRRLHVARWPSLLSAIHMHESETIDKEMLLGVLDVAVADQKAFGMETFGLKVVIVWYIAVRWNTTGSKHNRGLSSDLYLCETEAVALKMLEHAYGDLETTHGDWAAVIAEVSFSVEDLVRTAASPGFNRLDTKVRRFNQWVAKLFGLEAQLRELRVHYLMPSLNRAEASSHKSRLCYLPRSPDVSFDPGQLRHIVYEVYRYAYRGDETMMQLINQLEEKCQNLDEMEPFPEA
jgi:hypothetical protein